MIDIAEQTTCKACGKPLEQASRRGPRLREYCNGTCRQRAHRAKQQPAIVTSLVTMSEAVQARIAELEHEVQRLQERLNVEERFRTDTQVRHFKAWIRSHPQSQDTAETVPSSPMPTSAVPSSPMPSSTMPSSTVPSSTV